LIVPPGDRDFDARFGTDTQGEIPAEHLAHERAIASQSVSYEPTDPAAFRVMIEHIPIAPREYTFVDLGSGKGRALLLAALAGFRRIIGVEASPMLHRVAGENLKAWARAGMPARGMKLLLQDAAAYTPPPDPCLIFLFNPFHARVMGRVLRNLRLSLQRTPRPLWLLYYNPQLTPQLERERWLERVAVGAGYQQGDFAIWRARIDDRRAVTADCARMSRPIG
jgi:SAM-dependent methyltransferase